MGRANYCPNILTITSLGTLAVVVKKEAADTLSTIALALAILSFSAQLSSCSLKRTMGCCKLLSRPCECYTIASLAEIRPPVTRCFQTQTEQFGTVLHAALKIAIPAAVEDVTPVENSQEDRLLLSIRLPGIWKSVSSFG